MNTFLPALRNRACAVWLLLLVLALGNGCSGINATKSVSPLDFLLPGLHMRNDPPAPATPDLTNSVVGWHNASPVPTADVALALGPPALIAAKSP
jgi:hypothetical protein